MRKGSLSFVVLTAFLVTAVAFAANTRIVVSFVSQSSSGVTGDVTLTSLPTGGTMVHGKVQGLEPNVEYVSQSFTDGSCSASPANQLATFKSSPMGRAVFTARTGSSIEGLKSISVQTKSDLSLKACASVSP